MRGAGRFARIAPASGIARPGCFAPASHLPCTGHCAAAGTARLPCALLPRRAVGAGAERVKGAVGRAEGRSGPRCRRSRRRAPMAASTKAVSLFKRTLALSPPRGSPRALGRLRGEGRRGQQRGTPAATPAPLPAAAARLQPPLSAPFCPQDSLGRGLQTCYRYLNQTSRSFAAVIQALDGELR